MIASECEFGTVANPRGSEWHRWDPAYPSRSECERQPIHLATATPAIMSLTQRELRRGKIASSRQLGSGFLDPEVPEITLGKERLAVSDTLGR